MIYFAELIESQNASYPHLLFKTVTIVRIQTPWLDAGLGTGGDEDDNDDDCDSDCKVDEVK